MSSNSIQHAAHIASHFVRGLLKNSGLGLNDEQIKTLSGEISVRVAERLAAEIIDRIDHGEDESVFLAMLALYTECQKECGLIRTTPSTKH